MTAKTLVEKTTPVVSVKEAENVDTPVPDVKEETAFDVASRLQEREKQNQQAVTVPESEVNETVVMPAVEVEEVDYYDDAEENITFSKGASATLNDYFTPQVLSGTNDSRDKVRRLTVKSLKQMSTQELKELLLSEAEPEEYLPTSVRFLAPHVKELKLTMMTKGLDAVEESKFFRRIKTALDRI